MKKSSYALLFAAILIGVSQVSATSVYMRSTAGAPWGQTNNEASMDGVFGAGNWDDLRYETANTASLFSGSTDYIFMEGSDNNANELELFLATNLPAIESWVAGGGRLFVNSAPNEGDGMSYGFGGVSLDYDGFQDNDPHTGLNGAHAIFNGPFGATGSVFSGNSFAHANVSGPGLNDLIQDSNGDSVLSDMFWGNGYVMFGGMTTLNWQGANAFELRQNIIYYGANVPLAPIPEPATLSLMGMGLAGLALRARKKRLSA